MITEVYRYCDCRKTNLENDDKKEYVIVPEYRESPYPYLEKLKKQYPNWYIFYHSWGTVCDKPIPLPVEVLEVVLCKNEPDILMFLYERYI